MNDEQLDLLCKEVGLQITLDSKISDIERIVDEAFKRHGLDSWPPSLEKE